MKVLRLLRLYVLVGLAGLVLLGVAVAQLHH